MVPGCASSRLGLSGAAGGALTLSSGTPALRGGGEAAGGGGGAEDPTGGGGGSGDVEGGGGGDEEDPEGGGPDFFIAYVFFDSGLGGGSDVIDVSFAPDPA